MAGELVVGYDGSDGSSAALTEAIALCKDLGSELVVVFGYGIPVPERESADYREALHEVGQERTREALEQARAQGVTARAEVVFERAAEALVEAADKVDARMIVGGSYGERPLAAAILGRTPHKLVSIARRPVLVVHR
ncbi:MAG TPA: universal stress protein [Thermoleophilaceae bacterium]